MIIQNNLNKQTNPCNYQTNLPMRRKILFTPYTPADRTKNPHETTSEVLSRFFSTIPIFQNSSALPSALEAQAPLLNTMRASLIDSETLWIQPSQKVKLAINLQEKISNKEFEVLDPQNPLINTTENLTLNELTRFKTISPFWWNQLKAKHPTLQATGILLKKKQNEIRFLKGTSFINKVILEPNNIRLQFLWMEQHIDWDANDLLLLFSKMQVIKTP